jgi:hypothetical protein
LGELKEKAVNEEEEYLAKAEKAFESRDFEEARKNLNMIKKYKLKKKVDLESRIMNYDSY